MNNSLGAFYAIGWTSGPASNQQKFPGKCLENQRQKLHKLEKYRSK